MTDFVFIHGGSHGAWCWDDVISILEAKGFRCFAFDLPGHGDDQTARETVTRELYVEACISFIANIDSDDITLVGHSLAGIVLPDLTERFEGKISTVIYLAALVLNRGQAAIDLVPEDRRASYGEMANARSDKSIHLDYDAARSLFLSDLPESEARNIYKRLNPQPYAVYLSPAKYDALQAGVNYRYIVCLRDNALPQDKCRGWAEQLGVVIEEIDSGHDAMLSNAVRLSELLMKEDE
ncbi:alpha/beta fold hydrolase [Rubellicoccus peritrichatus]|uniref:Alpha/beta fold hydrolase n=1 Tax=Rubellicoccus peritrichatus TaxID=3080537 RepID=A0AAQ3QUQ5_9BACT|nr:alpha/beta fold hydrolase [Puniceicoccus sp. CR14]WOO40170.1 alpha/beta fold hydrolase [Puniceicoccus sp. CR14]